MTARSRLLHDLPSVIVIAGASLALGEVLLNGWIWFAALLGFYLARKDG